jgi:hypothetical protein
MAAGDDLVRQVRVALEHLHDLPYLQTHPLAARAGASGPSGRALQRALEQVLGALGTVRIPELLRLRYAEALEPPAVWPRPARRALTPDVAEVAWAAGQAMPLEEALAGALAGGAAAPSGQRLRRARVACPNGARGQSSRCQRRCPSTRTIRPVQGCG